MELSDYRVGLLVPSSSGLYDQPFDMMISKKQDKAIERITWLLDFELK
jgi:hypothetical protein